MPESLSLIAEDGHVVNGSVLHADNPSGYALLVHGITADRHEWGYFDFLSDELRQRGISVLAIDYRGHGQSGIPIGQLSLSGVFLDIMTAWTWIERQSVEQSLRRIVLGNSFGAGLSYLFGQLRPSVDTVALTCPVTSYVADIDRVSINWRENINSGFIQYATKKLSAAIVPEMFAFDSLIRECPLNKPTVIFHGTADSDVPYGEVKEFAGHRRQNVLLHAFEGMDHSFSAPDGTINRDKASYDFRMEAARAIADKLAEC